MVHKTTPKTILWILLCFVAVVFLFGNSFSAYFFQDDWFSLAISQVNHWSDFFKFFLPRTDLIYYRPLGMQVPFFISQSLFGITPLPFRFVTFSIHMINGWLVFELFDRLGVKKQWAWLGTFMYLTSAVHFILFYWAATFSFVLAPTLYLISILTFSNKHVFKSWIWFTCGLFVNELLMTLPAILLTYLFIKKELSTWKKTVGFWMTSMIYVGFRILIAKPTRDVNYKITFSPLEILKNLRDYAIWSLNWPEEIKNQFTNFILVRQEFIVDFQQYLFVLLTGSLLLLGIVIAAVLKHRFLFQKTYFLRLLIAGILWYFVTLVPVLFFSQHAFAYYLSLPLIGLLLFITGILYEISRVSVHRLLIQCGFFILLSSWFVTSWFTIKFNIEAHWAPRHAAVAGTLIRELKNEHPVLPKNTIVIIPKTEKSKDNKPVFADQHALQVVYKDTSITTYYGTKAEFLESIHYSPEDLEGVERNIVEIWKGRK